MARIRACNSVPILPSANFVSIAFLSLFQNFLLTQFHSSKYFTFPAFSDFSNFYRVSSIRENQFRSAFPKGQRSILSYFDFILHHLHKQRFQNITSGDRQQYILTKLTSIPNYFSFLYFIFISPTKKNHHLLFINKPTGKYEARNLHAGSRQCGYSRAA